MAHPDKMHPDSRLLASIAQRRLAVVGDCMLDRFLWGQGDRISPEAPVPVVRLDRESASLGGAANVAATGTRSGTKSRTKTGNWIIEK